MYQWCWLNYHGVELDNGMAWSRHSNLDRKFTCTTQSHQWTHTFPDVVLAPGRLRLPMIRRMVKSIYWWVNRIFFEDDVFCVVSIRRFLAAYGRYLSCVNCKCVPKNCTFITVCIKVVPIALDNLKYLLSCGYGTWCVDRKIVIYFGRMCDVVIQDDVGTWQRVP